MQINLYQGKHKSNQKIDGKILKNWPPPSPLRGEGGMEKLDL